MPIDKPLPERKSIRLPAFDYAQEGAFFITILSYHRKYLFGHITQGEMHLSPIGGIVKEVWESIHFHFPQASTDCFVVMPNHIHDIINIVRARHEVSCLQRQAVPVQERFGKPVPGSIPTIVRSFKSEATRCANIYQGTLGEKLWHRNYYEHVIRNEKEYQAIYDYILTNPLNWQDDN